MSDTSGRFRRAKPRKKGTGVKHVTLSEEATKKYEEIVRVRDEREHAYGRHLTDERKSKR
ncbi:MAG TPA: hypothetical protein VFK86_03215 [Bauldia sp.]|nr:hypothetical protein [Bauldia sp.]